MKIVVFLQSENDEMPRSSSWPRTSGFHPEDQGFESPTRYQLKLQFRSFFYIYSNKMSGIYIHFPFCNTKCIYCSFYSIASIKDQKAFVDSLLFEMDVKKEYLQNDSVHTVYFGGGTPSLFSIDHLSVIVSHLRKIFQLHSSIEFTFEANPDQCSLTYLKSVKDLGINRISIGVQSFQDHVLHFLGRKHDAQQAIQAVENARQAGFSNISIDLIYGIMERQAGEWQQDLNRALSLPIQHVSAYALTVEENTKLYQQMRKKGSVNHLIGKDIDEELAVSEMQVLFDAIQNSPFYRYEVSNFAIPGFESQHNSNYWNGTHYLGLGPSAHSYNGDSRSWNVSSLKKYIEGIKKGQPITETELLTLSDHFNETIMLGLRTSKGVVIRDIQKKYGEEFVQHLLHQLLTLDKTLYDRTEDVLTITDKGVPLIDNITEKLFISQD